MLMINAVRALMIALVVMIFTTIDQSMLREQFILISKWFLGGMVALFLIQASDHLLLKWFNPPEKPE
jgi:hypothetical protein